MTGADPREVRATLRAAGIEVPGRGRISGEHMAEYERLTGTEGEGTAAADPGELGGAGGHGQAEGEGAAGVEIRPSRPRGKAQGARSLADRVRSRGAGGQGQARGKASKARTGKRGAAQARPRVSVEGVITLVWGAGARAAAPVSENLAKCLGMQAPVAGLVLEDYVKGTIVDRALQPLARTQEKLEGVGSLVLLPMAIVMLEATEGMPEPKRSVRRAFLIPLAREGAAMWIKVAGPKVKERIERDRELGPVYQQADSLLIMLDMPFLTAADLGVTMPGPDAPAENGPPPDSPEAQAWAAQQFAAP